MAHFYFQYVDNLILLAMINIATCLGFGGLLCYIQLLCARFCCPLYVCGYLIRADVSGLFTHILQVWFTNAGTIIYKATATRMINACCTNWYALHGYIYIMYLQTNYEKQY